MLVKKNKNIYTILLSASLSFGTLLAVSSKKTSIKTADTKAGKAKYAVCIACHGVRAEGNKGLNGPALAGLQDWYLERQLKNFKEGIRGTHKDDIYGNQMRPMAMTLASDKDIKDVVAYIKTLGKKK